MNWVNDGRRFPVLRRKTRACFVIGIIRGLDAVAANEDLLEDLLFAGHIRAVSSGQRMREARCKQNISEIDRRKAIFIVEQKLHELGFLLAADL